tara:strand:+ start:28257 stop:28727 length:471 start_codon:yes stop_codon:yes gene_type:complete
MTPALPHISHVAQSIQLSVAPVFLLAGIGGFLNVCAGRLARVVDRARVVEMLVMAARGEEHDRYLREIRALDRRIQIVNNCISLAVLSACLICLVVIMLFANQAFSNRLDSLIASLFIASMVSVGIAFALFIIETRIGSQVVRIRNEILHHQADDE